MGVLHFRVLILVLKNLGFEDSVLSVRVVEANYEMGFPGFSCTVGK